MTEIYHKKISYDIIGACMEVHRQLGAGFLEGVYQEALAIELESRGIAFERESQLTIFYKAQPLAKKYIADFICGRKVVLEIKAVRSLLPEHEAQLFNYLRATCQNLGLLINFAKPSLEYKRVVI